MSDNKLRVAVIGAGGWGYQHARVFASRADTELCSVNARTYEKAKARADEFGVAAYTDVPTMLAEQKPDLVSVCLPGQVNFEPLMQLIDAGVPILTEKPLTYDYANATALIEAAEKKNLFFAINFNHSCSIPVALAKKDLDAGRLGDIVFVEWHFAQSGNFAMTHPQMEIIEANCHGLDLVEHLCGPIASISADMTDITGKSSYTTFSLSLRFQNGAVGTFLGSFDASDNYGTVQSLEVNGTKAHLNIHNNTESYTFQKKDAQTAQVWHAPMFDEETGSFRQNFDRHVERVLTALRAGEAPPIHARRGLRALELGLAGIKAFETGTRVNTL